MTKEPAGDSFDNEIYKELERVCMPILTRAAHTMAPKIGCSVDDALQEARIAFANGLTKYDYNKSSGQLYSYTKTIVHNALCRVMNHQRRQKRDTKLCVPLSGDLPSSVVSRQQNQFSVDPEDHFISECNERLFRMRLLNRLNEREQQVFACYAYPSDEFVAFMRNVGVEDADVATVANYLSLSKNVVDWTLHNIRRHVTQLIESEFPEVRDLAIRARQWPLFHASRVYADSEYIQKTLRDRKLDPKPIEPPQTARVTVRGELVERTVEKYAWGSIILLRYGARSATVIAEGRFNPLTGKVLSDCGYSKQLGDLLRWYPDVCAALKRKVE